jgi:hypothetical protein
MWFCAIYLFVTTRHGVSGKELQRQLGVTYKSAYRIGCGRAIRGWPRPPWCGPPPCSCPAVPPDAAGAQAVAHLSGTRVPRSRPQDRRRRGAGKQIRPVARLGRAAPAQKPKDKDKLYALHAPEVVCIAKGKAHTPYEFGAKVGIAVTNREGLVLAAKAFAGNPHDGTHPRRDTGSGDIRQRRRGRADLRRQGLSRPQLHRRGRGDDRRPPARPLRYHAPRAETTIGHRGHHRPHEDRRTAGPQLPPRPRW